MDIVDSTTSKEMYDPLVLLSSLYFDIWIENCNVLVLQFRVCVRILAVLLIGEDLFLN